MISFASAIRKAIKWFFPSIGLATALLLPVPPSSAAQEGGTSSDAWGRIKGGVGSVLESKEEKYRREQQQLDAEALQKAELAEQVRRQQEELRLIEAEKARLQGRSPRTPLPPTADAPRQSGEVEVFIASRCDDCLKAIGFLDASSVAYRVFDLENNPQAEQEYLRTVGRGLIPVIRVGGVVVRGYNPSELRRLFGQRGRTTSDAARVFPKRTDSRPATAAVLPPRSDSLPPAAAPAAETAADLQGSPSNAENQFDISNELPAAQQEEEQAAPDWSDFEQ